MEWAWKSRQKWLKKAQGEYACLSVMEGTQGDLPKGGDGRIKGVAGKYRVTGCIHQRRGYVQIFVQVGICSKFCPISVSSLLCFMNKRKQKQKGVTLDAFFFVLGVALYMGKINAIFRLFCLKVKSYHGPDFCLMGKQSCIGLLFIFFKLFALYYGHFQICTEVKRIVHGPCVPVTWLHQLLTYDQSGFILSLFLPVFIGSPRYCANSTVTTLGDWDSLLVVIALGYIVIASGLLFVLNFN